jgi:succinate dehydrogenase / fumarate reductase flavoprotein subunit
MQSKVGIVRNRAEMQEAVDAIRNLNEKASVVQAPGNREYNGGWHTALDLHNLLIISEAIARAGLEREESRGAHFREDFPDKSEEFGKRNIVLRKGPDGTMVVSRDPLKPMTEEQRQIVEEMK